MSLLATTPDNEARAPAEDEDFHSEAVVPHQQEPDSIYLRSSSSVHPTSNSVEEDQVVPASMVEVSQSFPTSPTHFNHGTTIPSGGNAIGALSMRNGILGFFPSILVADSPPSDAIMNRIRFYEEHLNAPELDNGAALVEASVDLSATSV